jgi:hypothetical protein
MLHMPERNGEPDVSGHSGEWICRVSETHRDRFRAGVFDDWVYEAWDEGIDLFFVHGKEVFYMQAPTYEDAIEEYAEHAESMLLGELVLTGRLSAPPNTPWCKTVVAKECYL